MQFNGVYSLQAARQNVYAALLNPTILKASIPGCEAAWYPDETHMKIRLLSPLPLPGLQGPYDVTVWVIEHHEPEMLIMQAERKGRIGGTISAIAQIALADDSNGSLLTYDATIDLNGPIAFVASPLFGDIFKHALTTFLKNLNGSLVTSQGRSA